MTIRDNIYKHYETTGEQRATLKEWLIPQFIKFIEHTSFEKKSVLDIGCGTGKYIAYLQNLGFSIAGIDSSPTAVEMSKKAIKDNENIICRDMYHSDIKTNIFDLIISISTIHHGSKKEVEKIIKNIYKALLPGGKIFITLPHYDSNNFWNSFQDQEKIAEWTYIPLSWPEKWLAHSFFTETEIQKIFKRFTTLSYILDDWGKWIIIGKK